LPENRRTTNAKEKERDRDIINLKVITFILERISHGISRFVARQLIAKIFQLLQLFPDVLHRVLRVVVVAAVGTARGLPEALLPLYHRQTGVCLARGGGIVRLEPCCALRIGRSGVDSSAVLLLKPRGRSSLTPRIVGLIGLIVLLVVDIRLARALALLRLFRVCYRARARVPHRSTASTI